MNDGQPPDLRVAATQQVFQELLKTDVGPDDDFFALGGHSLMVIDAIGKLKVEHGLVVSAKQFLSDASISAIAAACRPVEGELKRVDV